MWAFFGLGDPAIFHWRLCRFVSGSYWKTQVLSPVMTSSRNSGLPSRCSKKPGTSPHGEPSDHLRAIWAQSSPRSSSCPNPPSGLSSPIPVPQPTFSMSFYDHCAPVHSHSDVFVISGCCGTSRLRAILHIITSTLKPFVPLVHPCTGHCLVSIHIL